MIDSLRRYGRELGALRLGLLIAAAVALILIPASGTRAIFSGWPLVTTVLVPVLTPMLFLVLLLDALMARVFLADAKDMAHAARLKRVILINLLVAAALLVRWLPFYTAVRV